eukprot:GILJ01002292.1.p1 GENE.GILJ01002292.1~~GILJ01002292.1.p1  ORF type:complete len:185 (+),score=13.72 GILJ01002292.1:223-777(+)
MGEAAGADFQVKWHPFLLQPSLPKEGVPYADYIQKKYGIDATAMESMFRRLESTGKTCGINFTRRARISNSIDAHRLLQYAATKSKGNEMGEALFQAYFEAGRDIASSDVLLAEATRVGLDTAEVQRMLESDEGLSHVLDSNAEAHRRNISGVPHFIIQSNGRSFEVSGGQPPSVFLNIFDRLQ